MDLFLVACCSTSFFGASYNCRCFFTAAASSQLSLFLMKYKFSDVFLVFSHFGHAKDFLFSGRKASQDGPYASPTVCMYCTCIRCVRRTGQERLKNARQTMTAAVCVEFS